MNRETDLPIVFICSPFAGNIEKNTEQARDYCRFAVDHNVIPFAPHLLFPQFMDEHNPDSRSKGMLFGCTMLEKCQELWVFGDTISKGMGIEIQKAQNLNIPVRYFDNNGKEKTRNYNEWGEEEHDEQTSTSDCDLCTHASPEDCPTCPHVKEQG